MTKKIESTWGFDLTDSRLDSFHVVYVRWAGPRDGYEVGVELEIRSYENPEHPQYYTETLAVTWTGPNTNFGHARAQAEKLRKLYKTTRPIEILKSVKPE